MTKYKNKYRVETTRLPYWDYASNGWYFVTICVKNRVWEFGRIQNGEMQLSSLGEIAHQYLVDIPHHFPQTHVDTFVVMPNHVHAIIIICKNVMPGEGVNSNEKSSKSSVETPYMASLQTPRKFGPQKPGSLSVIIQNYKAAVTRQARKLENSNFAWQERFYDHIIRNEKSLENIREYIVGNPVKWQDDDYYV